MALEQVSGRHHQGGRDRTGWRPAAVAGRATLLDANEPAAVPQLLPQDPVGITVKAL